MKETNRSPRDWPAWLEPLRPDDLARARMRAVILGDAVPLLIARGLGTWEVAAGWARMLMPIAAVLLLFFAGLAHQAAPRAIGSPPLTLEELAREEDREGTFGMLTAGVEPSSDWALSAVIRHETEDR